MKWLFSRDRFINEAKLRDVLSDTQKRRLKVVWGEKYLDYEEVKPTDRIIQGKWKLSDEDKDEIINRFFKTDYSWVRENLSSLPDKFSEVLNKCLSIQNKSDILRREDLDQNQVERLVIGFGGKEEFNIKKLKISQISCLNYPIFKTLNASETKSNSRIVRDDRGLPIKGEDDKLLKEPKEPGELSFSGNLANLNTFITGYNTAFPDEKVNANIFLHSHIQNITNMITDNPDIVDFDLFGDHNMYLLIEHNAVNIMNMSVSKFYKSCQELYFGGGHGIQYMKGLLINVFDPNSIPAFIVFDTPYYNVTEEGSEKVEKLSDVLPLCRLVIRSIEPFGDSDKTKLFFDSTYPDRMKEMTRKIIEKYSGNVSNDDGYIRKYPFAPDIEISDYDILNLPYMDNLEVVKGTRIGRNTKSLYLSAEYDWSNAIIDKDINIKEVIIETPNIPKNFFNIKLNPEWIKFKYITINDFSVFNNIITDSVSLYQCKLNSNFIEDLYKVSPNLKKLSLGSVSVKNFNDLSMFKSLEELELIYTISSKEDLEKLLSGLDIKKLTLSGDVVRMDRNKNYIRELKRKGVTVLLKGLVL